MSSAQATVRLSVPRPYAKQALIAATTKKRVLVKCGRRAGKTWLAAHESLKRAGRGSKVLYGAPTAEQTDAFCPARVRQVDQIDVGRRFDEIETPIRGIDQMRGGGEVAVNRSGAENAVNVQDKAVDQGGVGQAGVGDDGGIEGLLVLPEADVADEPRVVQDHPLAPDRHGRLGNPLIAKSELVDLGLVGVGNDRILGLAVGCVVELLRADVVDVLKLDPGRKIMDLAGEEADPGAQGGGFGFSAGTVIIDVLEPVTGVEIGRAPGDRPDEGIAGRLTGGRRRNHAETGGGDQAEPNAHETSDIYRQMVPRGGTLTQNAGYILSASSELTKVSLLAPFFHNVRFQG